MKEAPFFLAISVILSLYLQKCSRISVISLPSTNRRTERQERKLCKLKILQAKRNADDRHTEKATDNQKAKRKLQTAKDQPKNIDEDGSRAVSVNDFLAERQQTELCKLKALQADGNTDDRHTPKTAEHQPKSGSNQASEYDP